MSMQIVGKAKLSKGGKGLNLQFNSHSGITGFFSIPIEQIKELMLSNSQVLFAEIREYTKDEV